METIDITHTQDVIHNVTVHGDTIYLARQSGLYRSKDNGASWENVYQAWMPDEVVATFASALLSDATMIAGIHGGIALSSDKGATWQARYFRQPAPLVTCMAVLGDDNLLAGTYEDGVFLSFDAGENWQPYNFGLLDLNILAVDICPASDNRPTIFVGTETGIFKSKNGGRLWHDVSLSVESGAVLSVAASPIFNQDGVVFAGTEANGLLQSTDGGATWTTHYATEAAINALILPTDYVNSHRVIALMNDAVLISDDGGLSWETIIEEDVSAIALDDATLIAALADGTIHTHKL